MVLFSGYDGTVLGDAFTLSLGPSPAWAPLGASGGPPPARAIPGVVYAAPLDRMVMFGGFDGAGSLNDVWALDLATTAWTQLSPSGGPPSPRQSPATVYDTPRNRMVIFGGNDNSGDIQDPFWSLSLGSTVAWTDLGGRRPPSRWNAATAFDPTRHVMWIHGGVGWDSGQLIRSDLWSLPVASTAGWSQPTTTGTPPGKRFGHSAIYDVPRDRLVFFGGSDSTSNLNDVWALTLAGTPAWSHLSPSGPPPDGRTGASAVYDAVNDRMVIFGGNTGSGSQNDVWALSFAGTPAWTQLSPTGTPPPLRSDQAAALDAGTNRLIVFGGANGPELFNDVYALTLTGSPVWTKLLPTGTPPAARQAAAMVSVGTQMVVFGGDATGTGTGLVNDAWLLSLDPTPAWRLLDVGPLFPAARMSASAAFDQPTLKLAVYGGAGLFTAGDTWLLQLDQRVPTLASLVSTNAEPGRVELAWEIPSSASARVYRKVGDGPWTGLDLLTPDGTGRIAYVDLDVIAGSRYGYRLGLLEPGGEVFAGEVWVDVPEAARFALRGMTPNPAPAGAGLIAFSLPDASPARLEVVDIAGRQVFSREVGSLGRGEHALRVSGAQPLAPGVYLVRLTQGGRSLTAKAVTIR
jgi:hypothetical protein